MITSQPGKATPAGDALTINVVRNVVHHRRWCAR